MVHKAKKYKVTIATSYDIEADSEVEAESKAWEKVKEDFESDLAWDTFGANAEEEEEE